MKSIKFISLLAFILCLSSCSSIPFNDNLLKVVEGMNQKEVSELLGTPTHRRFDQGLEEWEYIRSYSTEQNRVVLVTFMAGRVTAMDSFYTPIQRGPNKPGEGNSRGKGETPHHK